jgi:hypothetical protein
MTATDRFFVVRIERGLHPSRLVGIMCGIRLIPGVVSVADLAAITPETLEALMLAPDPQPVVNAPRVEQLGLLA